MRAHTVRESRAAIPWHANPRPGLRSRGISCSALPTDITYVGYDMSPEYIAAAQKRFAGRGTFHCRLLEQAEVATLEPFDLVLGSGVLHHLDDATARQFMAVAKAALKPRRANLHGGPLLCARPEPHRAFPDIA